ncbi:MAG: threonine synthase [Thaumarchaeota archaeon S15]|nr:MAG: threonine synthase [Thaumarchaeota archaeon S15]
MAREITLACRECGREYDPEFRYVCAECFGPLDVAYAGAEPSRARIGAGPKTYWRYGELLPIVDRRHIVDIGAGMTPLTHARRLGEALGLSRLYVKNDSVNPTFSFKDRPAGVAVSRSRELGLPAVGCASTGNLASATAAHAAAAGLPCRVWAPAGIEAPKVVQALSYGAELVSVDGTYDDANRMAARAGDREGHGIVNINMRSYYVEGSKTLAFEAAEQLGWEVPDRLVVPVGSGAMLNAICKGFGEMRDHGLVGDISPVERPETVAKSLAIGDPGDGRYVLRRLEESSGTAEEAGDAEILDAILLLARTEGIFTEPAGGVPVAVLKKMAEAGLVDRDETIVCYVTGNGLKATGPLEPLLRVPAPVPAMEAMVA